MLLGICSYARGLKSSSSSSSSNPSSFVPTDGWADDNSISPMKSFSPNGLLPLLTSKALGGTGGGWARLAEEGGVLIPLLDPVLKFRRLPFSCWARFGLLNKHVSTARLINTDRLPWLSFSSPLLVTALIAKMIWRVWSSACNWAWHLLLLPWIILWPWIWR